MLDKMPFCYHMIIPGTIFLDSYITNMVYLTYDDNL